MIEVFPDYYSRFRCAAGRCSHSCCIGWEIDVDERALAFYDGVPGEMGERLRQAIDREDPPHFILGPGERCPFLNHEGLCDIILTLGEERLCAICTDHPRFRNELPGRVETGLGLCCEEAGRLILGREEPVALLADEEPDQDDAVIGLRDRVIACLQDRERSLPERVERMLRLCGSSGPDPDMDRWVAVLLSLERLDEAWTRLLVQLGEGWRKADLEGFDAFMADRRTEYEQLLVYLIYRHLANAFCREEVAARAAFAALGYLLLRQMGAVLWTQTGSFSFAQQVELARLFSSEIEYSQENLDMLLEELAGNGEEVVDKRANCDKITE